MVREVREGTLCLLRSTNTWGKQGKAQDQAAGRPGEPQIGIPRVLALCKAMFGKVLRAAWSRHPPEIGDGWVDGWMDE